MLTSQSTESKKNLSNRLVNMNVIILNQMLYQSTVKCVRDQWHMERSFVRYRSSQVVSAMAAGGIDSFDDYVLDIVRTFLRVRQNSQTNLPPERAPWHIRCC